MLIFISTSVVVVSIFNVMGSSGSVAAVGVGASVGVTGAVLVVVEVLSSAVAVAVASEYIKVDAVNLEGIVAFVVAAVYVVEVVQYDAVTIRLQLDDTDR